MAHMISERRRRQRMHEFAPEIAREQKRRSRQEVLHARRIVELWNLRAKRGRKPSFFPSVDTALAAGAPVVDVFCHGCRSIGSVDLRTLDLYGGMPISALIPKLSCRRCCPNPPFAVLVGLRAGPPTWRDRA